MEERGGLIYLPSELFFKYEPKCNDKRTDKFDVDF